MTEPEVAIVEENYTPDLEAKVSRFKFTQVLWLIFGLIESLILIRVVLKFIAANPAAGFAAFIYSITEPFLAPFMGLTGTPAVGGVVLELSSIIAIIVYALLAGLIVKTIDVMFYNPRAPRVSTTVISQDKV